MIMVYMALQTHQKMCLSNQLIIEQIPKTTGWIIRPIKIYTRFWIIKVKTNMSRNLFQKK